jgi:hypothetical protein
MLWYFSRSRCSWSAPRAVPWLIQGPDLYLTDFLESRFSGENAKNRAFYGGKKMKTATVHLPNINDTCTPWNINGVVTPSQDKMPREGCYVGSFKDAAAEFLQDVSAGGISQVSEVSRH